MSVHEQVLVIIEPTLKLLLTKVRYCTNYRCMYSGHGSRVCFATRTPKETEPSRQLWIADCGRIEKEFLAKMDQETKHPEHHCNIAITEVKHSPTTVQLQLRSYQTLWSLVKILQITQLQSAGTSSIATASTQ